MNQTGKRMNVLFLVVDDLRPQLGCYGKEQIISPNIDRLAEEGLLFERAYCQQAVCGPSRASMLSGCRPDTIGDYYFGLRLRDNLPDVLTLPQHFKNNGYQTVSIGKIYHHIDDDKESWSNPPFSAEGDWQGRGYLTDEAIDSFVNDESTGRTGLGPAFEAADVSDNAYQDGKNLEQAIRELNRLKDETFFMALGFHKPHLPFNAPKKYWDIYQRDEIDLANNPFAPEGSNEFSLMDFGELRGYFAMPVEGEIPDDKARELIHGYYSCVTYIDTLIGRLIDELERLELKDNTIIVLWGDHGWKLGEHGSWCKHSNFEIDTRAPLIVNVPGIDNKKRNTFALIEFVDIYPSLCDLCGMETPEHIEGTSFLPVLENSDVDWKKAAFSQYPRNNDTVMGYSIRTRDFRYTEWKELSSNKILANELYDHRIDFQENINQSNNDKYHKVVKELAKILHDGWEKARPDKDWVSKDN